MNSFSAFPFFFFFLIKIVEEIQLSSPAGDPQALSRVYCRLYTSATGQKNYVDKKPRSWRDDIVGQQGADTKEQRKIEDSGGGLLPAVEGHSLQQNRIKQNWQRSIILDLFLLGTLDVASSSKLSRETCPFLPSVVATVCSTRHQLALPRTICLKKPTFYILWMISSQILWTLQIWEFRKIQNAKKIGNGYKVVYYGVKANTVGPAYKKLAYSESPL